MTVLLAGISEIPAVDLVAEHACVGLTTMKPSLSAKLLNCVVASMEFDPCPVIPQP